MENGKNLALVRPIGSSRSPDSAMEFPLDAFPGAYQEIIQEIAEAHQTGVEIPAAALLAGSGACIGRTLGISIKPGWVEHPNLYMVVIAPTGFGKSPAVRAVFRHISDFERERQACGCCACKITLYDGVEYDLPQWTDVMVDDVTLQALSDTLFDNPRGVMWHRDEISGIFYELRRNHVWKSRILGAYNSEQWKVDRVSNKRSMRIPYATLSIFGTIQPEVVGKTFDESDFESGFLSRFLFVHSEDSAPKPWTDRMVSNECFSFLQKHFRCLLVFDFQADGKPTVISFNEEARDLYIRWYEEMTRLQWVNENMKVAVRKLQGQCLRLILIMHILQCVLGEVEDSLKISPDSVARVIRLMEYFKLVARMQNRASARGQKRATLSQKIAPVLDACQGPPGF